MKYNITDFMGYTLTVRPRLELYSVQDFMGKEMPGLGIVLEDITESEQNPTEYCVLTVSLGEFIGMKNCAYIDSNNCDFTEQLMEQGFGKPTGLTGRSGFCEYPLWIFEEEMLREMGAEKYQAYSDAYERCQSGA